MTNHRNEVTNEKHDDIGFKRNDWNRRDKFRGDISDYFEGSL